jgi:hypothetical protein
VPPPRTAGARHARSQKLRRVAVNPIQSAKFTVVRSGMFDLKSKDVERNILPLAVFFICLNSTSDPLDLLAKPAQ